MVKTVDLISFLKAPGWIFDVRSPGEYTQGRIPMAHNLPLFSNAERVQVGTTYKRVGRKQAVLQGMEYAAPKFSFFVEETERILSTKGPQARAAKIHCWRGGMRSASIAMFLEMAGIETMTLQGGYKTFRRWVLQFLHSPLRLHVLGGMTGCGKTAILHSLKAKGAQILDLEALAGHRGSSFGMLGLPPQPTNEQFENEIAITLSQLDLSKPIWIEDESRLIGTCKVPDSIFFAMRSSPLYIIERSLEERIANLQQIYWNLPPNELIASTKRLNKKLGSLRTKEIIRAIESNDLSSATLQLLEYYDASYQHQMLKHQGAVFTFTGRVSVKRDSSDEAAGDEGIAPAIAVETDTADACVAADGKLTVKGNTAHQRTQYFISTLLGSDDEWAATLINHS